MSERPPGRLILHIGMHKTGSTSVQRFFRVNRRGLRWFGINYPDAFAPDGRHLPKHNDYFHAISHEKDFGAPHPQYGAAAPMIAALGERVAAGRVTVISAEGLSGESPAFAQAFGTLAGQVDVRVVCFLRPQADWAEAFYAQMVMSDEVRERRPFANWLNDPATQAHMDYAGILDWWAEAFGEAALRVIHYGRHTRPVHEFLAAAGLPRGLRWLPGARAHLNVAPPASAVQARLGSTEIPGFGDAEQKADFQCQFDDANDQIRRRFRPDLAQLFD